MLIDAPTMPPTLLPLEEPKPQAPRRRYFWEPKPTDAEILRYAVHVIDERGWTTGTWVDGQNGRVCLLGAIGVAALESGRKAPYKQFESRVMHASDTLVGIERRALQRWNDSLPFGEGDPVTRVKKQLRKMAKRAEENGGTFPRR